jgi:hypothetical protein
VISPALGLMLLRREEPQISSARDEPSTVMPVISGEDRALCRAEGVSA